VGMVGFSRWQTRWRRISSLSSVYDLSFFN